jgi:hypothetical protein
MSNNEYRMSKECILPAVSFPSRASESNDWVERSI